VKVYDSFQITWKLNSNYNANQPDVGWVSIRTTNNPIYLTYHDPVGFPTQNGTNLYWTLVHLSSKSAARQNQESEVIAKIWQEFANRNITRRSDGKQLTYYIPGATREVTLADATRELLASGHGVSTAWVESFLRVLSAQGIAGGRIIRVVNKDAQTFGVRNTGILVKNNAFPANGTSGDHGYPFLLGEIRRLEGIPGQGNANPPNIFNLHYIAQVDGKYYDPSYGTGPYDKLDDWENAALDGFWRLRGRDELIFKKNNLNTPEIRTVEVNGTD
jgi:hypothetical protein